MNKLLSRILSAAICLTLIVQLMPMIPAHAGELNNDGPVISMEDETGYENPDEETGGTPQAELIDEETPEDEPGEITDPDESEQPDEPGDPGEPVDPDEPGDPEDPEDPGDAETEPQPPKPFNPVFRYEEGRPLTDRIAGASRYETSFKISDKYMSVLGLDMLDSIIVTSGTTFPDALSGSSLSAKKGAPVILTCAMDKYRAAAYEYILENVKDGGTVYMLGGESVIPYALERDLKTAGYNVIRLAGKDRYITNLKMLEHLGEDDRLLVCSGQNYPDAAVGSATGYPILLVNGSTLTEDQKSLLSAMGKRDIYIVGGTGVISQSVENELKQYDTDGTVTRTAGKDRYKTAEAVAEAFFPETCESVSFADGSNFPDSLSGGPLSYITNSPIIYGSKRPGSAYSAMDFAERHGARHAYVYGGTAVISSSFAQTAIYGSIGSSQARPVNYNDITTKFMPIFELAEKKTVYVELPASGDITGDTDTNLIRRAIINKISDEYFRANEFSECLNMIGTSNVIIEEKGYADKYAYVKVTFDFTSPYITTNRDQSVVTYTGIGKPENSVYPMYNEANYTAKVSGNEIRVDAQFTSAVSSAKLFYKPFGKKSYSYKTIPITNGKGSAVIDCPDLLTKYVFYVQVNDKNNRITYLRGTAPLYTNDFVGTIYQNYESAFTAVQKHMATAKSSLCIAIPGSVKSGDFENDLKTRGRYQYVEMLINHYDFIDRELVCFYSISNAYTMERNGKSYSVLTITFDPSERSVQYDRYVAVKNFVERAVSACKRSDVKDTIRNVNSYICDRATYDHAAANAYNSHGMSGLDMTPFTAYGMTKNGKAVCEAYAVMTNFIMNACGIDSIYVASDYHAWNIVKYGNLWYHFDATWNDLNGRTICLMKGSKYVATLWHHTLSSGYQTAAFRAKYPISETNLSI